MHFIFTTLKNKNMAFEKLSNNADSNIQKIEMIKLYTITCLLAACFITTNAQSDTILRITLPPAGKFINNQPSGKGWVDLLAAPDSWNAEKKYWQWNNGMLHGEANGENVHHYAWTKKVYTDFELNVMIKMTGGEDANSGVCIRLHPANWDDVPGYQVDMGKGYWGSLWEERRAGMVQKYPDSLALQLVKANDWNHYYIIAKGHHIQAWLNGVKTIDIVHETGFSEGTIGFQLCHERRHTIVNVKSLYIREIK
jgi:hypothetical protein